MITGSSTAGLARGRAWRRAEAATAAVPSMLWLFAVKHATSTSGICAVQIPEMSLTPVRLSIKT